MSGVCPVCDAPQDQGLLCHADTTRLERDLGDVAAIVAELDTTISKQARIGNASGPGGLARERTPINVGAMQVADDLQNTLTTWARDVSGGTWQPDRVRLRIYRNPEAKNLGPLCNWPCGHASCEAMRSWQSFDPEPLLKQVSLYLLSHIDAIRRHPAVNELVDEITDAIAQARRVVDRPADRIYMGQCLMETPDDEGRLVTCLEEIWARPTASEARCKVCGTDHPVRERRAWLLKKAEDYLFTVAQASEMLGSVGHITVTQASIRGYIHRGKIGYRSGKLIRLGDLLAVVVDEGERRTA